MRDPGLIEFRRHNPEVVRQRTRDLFDDFQTRRVDAVVIGTENPHSAHTTFLRFQTSFVVGTYYRLIAAVANPANGCEMRGVRPPTQARTTVGADRCDVISMTATSLTMPEELM